MGWPNAYDTYNSDWDRAPTHCQSSINDLIVKKDYDRVKQRLGSTDINTTNQAGETLLHTHLKHCVKTQDTSHPLSLADMRLLILLLKSGCNPDIADDSGVSCRKYLERFGYTIHGYSLSIKH